jgi:hypothetical protein
MVVVPRRAFVRVVGDDEGEGGADGEGEGDDEDDEDDEGALERRVERKRGNAPIRFHTRVSSPPSKSKSSSEEDASSTSVSPPSLSSDIVLPDAVAAAVFVVVGRLYVGKMRRWGDGSTGGGKSVGEDKGEHGRGGESRCELPYARKTKGMLPTPLRCGTVCVFRVI